MSTFAVNELEIKVYGGTITKELAVSIGDLETVEIPLESTVETWNTIGDAFQHAMKTGVAMSLTFEGKYNTTDAGQKALRATWDKVGTAAELHILITYPDASSFDIVGPIGIENFGGGDATAIGAFSFGMTSNGKPVYTPAA